MEVPRPTPVSPVRSVLRSAASRTLPRRSDYPRTRRVWAGDLLAGITVGIVALTRARELATH